MPQDAILSFSDYRDDKRPALRNAHLKYKTWLIREYKDEQGRDAPLPPEKRTGLETVDAFVDAGRWLWMCGDCNAAIPAEHGALSICPSCGLEWVRVKYPRHRKAIEEELLKQPGFRKNAPIRQWRPHMTLDDLRERTAKAEAKKAKGESRIRSLSIGSTRTWAVGEVLTAANKNTYERDVLNDLAGRNGNIDLENNVRIKRGTGHDTQPLATITQDFIELPQHSTGDTTASRGRIAYRSDIDRVRIVEGSTWRNIPQIPVPLVEGGTGAITAAQARINLGFDSGLPAGTIVYWGGGHADDDLPDGFLRAQGQQVSRTTYANLYAAIGNAHTPMYAIEQGGLNIWRINLESPEDSEEIFTLTDRFAADGSSDYPNGLANVDATLYAIDDEPIPPLYSLDTISREVTEIGNVPAGARAVTGMAYDGTTVFGVVEDSRALYEIDLDTPANSSLIGTLPALCASPTAMAWDGTTLYIINGADDNLWAVDRDAPSDSVNVGELPLALSLPTAMAYDGDTMYAINHNFDINNPDDATYDLWEIDIGTPLSSTLIGSLPDELGLVNGIAWGADVGYFRLSNIPDVGGAIALIQV